MKDTQHRGVGVVIADYDKTLFYLQQKDETYPIAEYRHCYSFFGGAVEHGEDELTALERELMQEIPERAAEIFSAVQEIGAFRLSARDRTYMITLFEAGFPAERLYEFEKSKVMEGGGVLVPRTHIREIKFVWGLEETLDSCLSPRQ